MSNNIKKRTRCPNGTRKNKKTGECESKTTMKLNIIKKKTLPFEFTTFLYK